MSSVLFAPAELEGQRLQRTPRSNPPVSKRTEQEGSEKGAPSFTSVGQNIAFELWDMDSMLPP